LSERAAFVALIRAFHAGVGEFVAEIAALAVLAIDTMVSSGTTVQTGTGVDSMAIGEKAVRTPAASERKAAERRQQREGSGGKPGCQS
jgi:hypothetical protein